MYVSVNSGINLCNCICRSAYACALVCIHLYFSFIPLSSLLWVQQWLFGVLALSFPLHLSYSIVSNLGSGSEALTEKPCGNNLSDFLKICVILVFYYYSWWKIYTKIHLLPNFLQYVSSRYYIRVSFLATNHISPFTSCSLTFSCSSIFNKSWSVAHRSLTACKLLENTWYYV